MCFRPRPPTRSASSSLATPSSRCANSTPPRSARRSPSPRPRSCPWRRRRGPRDSSQPSSGRCYCVRGRGSGVRGQKNGSPESGVRSYSLVFPRTPNPESRTPNPSGPLNTPVRSPAGNSLFPLQSLTRIRCSRFWTSPCGMQRVAAPCWCGTRSWGACRNCGARLKATRRRTTRSGTSSLGGRNPKTSS